MEKEYLSIKEFASAVGVSQQAIYKQLNNKLKDYLKIVEGKKMLDKSAFALFEKQENSTDIQQQLLNVLQTELKEKSLRIESLEKQIVEKDKQISELHKLLDQAQQLHALEQQKVLALESKVEAEASEEVPQRRWWRFWQ